MPMPEEDAKIMNTSSADGAGDTLDQEGLPPEAVLLLPSVSRQPMPVRMPAGAWGLVVVAARLTEAMGDPLVRLAGLVSRPDTAIEDTTDLLAGVWIFQRPPADLHDGDVVLRLRPRVLRRNPRTYPNISYADLDVEVLVADAGAWRRHALWRGMSARWSHEIALILVQLMRDGANRDHAVDARITSLAGRPGPAPDALADLVEAGSVERGRTGSVGITGRHRR